MYIGQTTRSIHRRWIEHLHDCETENHHLYLAMRKYGKENFSISMLEERDDSVLSEREKYWIAKENSYWDGYNSTIGGEGIVKLDYSDKFIPVIQFDKNGNKIAEYSSALEAEQKTGISRSSICSVCKGTYLSVRGFQWRYKEDVKNPVGIVETYTRPCSKYAVVQFTLDGERIAEYESINAACRQIGGGTTQLRKCLSGVSKTAFGYQWKLKSEVGNTAEIKPTNYTGKGGRPPKRLYSDEVKGVA